MILHAFIFLLTTVWTVNCRKLPILNASNSIDSRHYSIDGYNLTITNTVSQLNAAVRQRLIELYFQIYPCLVNRFNPHAPRSIQLVIDGENRYPFWGSAVNSEMIINGYRLRDPLLFPRYYDIFLHELAHLVQQYTTRNLADVQWLGEGLADYVRYTYGSSNMDANWPLPDYSFKQHFTDSSKVSARFLIWLEYRYSSKVIDELDRRLRDVTYSQNRTWNELTGKSIEQLWSEYAEKSHVIRNIPSLRRSTKTRIVLSRSYRKQDSCSFQ